MHKIREYRVDDRDQVAALILGIQQGEFAIPVTLAGQPDLLDVKNFYQRGDGNFWVAESAGMIVGTIGLKSFGNGQAALRKMFVAAEYRGRKHGVGQQLLETLLEWCVLHGISEVFLGTVEKLVSAMRFYEKNQFTLIARDDLPLMYPRTAVDTIFYFRAVSG
jgi:N-acetylglutamate synthase-like GNAT family acetyltransferase